MCPLDQTEWLMSKIGKMVYGNYQFGGYTHSDFGSANDSVFMNELHEALAHLRPVEHHTHVDMGHHLGDAEFDLHTRIEHEREIEASHPPGFDLEEFDYLM